MSDDIVNRLRTRSEFKGEYAMTWTLTGIQLEAADEIERLRAKVARLREALSPFANATARYNDSWVDWQPVAFTVENCRRARAAFKETER